jgi:homoserine O-acetyltransferase/O-succinyltransferase
MPEGSTLAQAIEHYHMIFEGNDANDLILQCRTWESNNVGNTPPFDGDVEAALRSIEIPVLYMPSATDLYFPLTDARYEASFLAKGELVPIPSIWGHPAGAGVNPEDEKFLTDHIAAFMDGGN